MRIGFLEFVDQRRAERWPIGSPFPELTAGSKGGFGEAFSKWFGRYKRSLGIDNQNSVFHSFRHGFKDALRAAGVNEDINDALTGHSGGNAVARGYGWKEWFAGSASPHSTPLLRKTIPRPRPVGIAVVATCPNLKRARRSIWKSPL